MIRAIALSVFVTVGMTGALLAQDVAAPVAETNAVEAVEAVTAPNELDQPVEEKKDNWEAVMKFVNDLGPTCGLGFAILSVLGLGCVLERFVNLRRSRVVPDGFTAEAITLWKKGDMDGVSSYCAKSNSMLARVTETLIEHKTSDYQEAKLFAEDKAGRELRLESRKSSLIAIVATVAPMLGLFGTVLGLRDAFGRVAAVGDMGNPAILADSINLALVTTVVGLALAMPALLVYNYFKDRLSLYGVILEEEISDLVNGLFIRK